MKTTTLFASDLDNTLLFSYKHRQPTDLCVEYLEGKAQGYVTEAALRLLPRVQKSALFVPVTSRSIAQYQRIRWPEGCLPKYAVTTNGAILLVDGKEDRAWREESKALVDPWRGEMAQVEALLPGIPAIRRFRMIDDMYLFAACDTPEEAQQGSLPFQGTTGLDVAVSGRKVYFFPPSINKGDAVDRLRERFAPQQVICAGDSVIDLPMLCKGDAAIVPHGALLAGRGPSTIFIPTPGKRFPDFVLESVLSLITP